MRKRAKLLLLKGKWIYYFHSSFAGRRMEIKMDEKLQTCINKIKAGKIEKEVVHTFLRTYYDCIEDMNPAEDAPYPEKLTKPLRERKFGIYEAMSWLAQEKYNMNEGDDTPLMETVGYADAPMTEFLIQNGANANYWPDMDEIPGIPRSNYYLEDIDIAYFEESWPLSERYINALLETAKVLLSQGNTGSFWGLCLSADAEKREITIGPPKYRY